MILCRVELYVMIIFIDYIIESYEYSRNLIQMGLIYCKKTLFTVANGVEFDI